MIKYIFCINTGRSGSGYLAEVFSAIKNSNSYHEAKPVMNGSYMRDFGVNGKIDDKLLQTKLDFIKSNPLKIYIETNHLFIKSFGWQIPYYFSQDEVAVIILKRPHKKVVQSMLKINSDITTKSGFDWIINPLMSYQLLNNTKNDKIKYSVFRIYRKIQQKIKLKNSVVEKKLYAFNKKWFLKYCDYINILSSEYQKKFNSIKFLELDLEDLNDLDTYNEIEKKLNICFDKEKLKKRVGKKINTKTHAKLKNEKRY